MRTAAIVLSCAMLVGLTLDTASAGSLSPDYTAMQEAYQTGSLSAVEYVGLVVQALNDPRSLDRAWLTEHAVPGFCLTPIIKEIERVAREDAAAREALKGLRSRPPKQATFVSPEGLFTVHYDTTGAHAVLDPDVDVDPADGVPDYVNRCAEYFDYAWHFEVDTLGYDPTGSDYGLGGGYNYDVYIHHNAGAAGMTYSDSAFIPPEYADRPDARCTHVHVDPTMAEFGVLEDPLPLLMTTAAHELHHGIQSVYDWFTAPWAEQTAVWMEEVVHDELDPYIKYFDYCSLVGYPSYLDVPHWYLYTHSGMIHYTAVVWPLFLEHQFGRDFMRQTWVEMISPAVGEVQAVEIVLQSHGSSYAEGVPEFQAWNYFTGERDDGYHYEEGDSLPLVHVMTEHMAFPVLNAGPPTAEKPQGYGCNYIEFPELEGVDHLRIAFSDENATTRDWAVNFIRWDPDTSEVIPMTIESGEGETILFADEFSTIVMIPTSTEQTETYHNYSYSVWANEYVLFEEMWTDDQGDGDERLEAGETFSLGASFYSIAAEWENAALTVSTADPDLEIVQAYATGESVSPGDTFDIPAGTILLSVADSLQAAHMATIELHVGPAGESPLRTFEVDLLLGIPPLLVMDDDGGGSVESYVTASLDSLQLLHDVWDDHVGMYPAYPLAALDLAGYDEIIWLTGDAGNALSSADIDSIAAILQGDGHLLLSGQDIAESLAATTQGVQFMEQWLGVQYDGYESGLLVNGAEGDPLYGGMQFATSGATWDGANNQTSRDRLSALPEVNVCLEYQSGYPAAVRRDWGQARLVFAGFGVEAVIDDSPNFSSRRQLLSIGLDYLANGVTYAGDPSVPQQLRLLSVWPNPTSGYAFARLDGVGGSGEVEVFLTNLAGRRVASLFSRASGDRGGTVIVFRVPPAVPTGHYILQLRFRKAAEAVPLSVVR